MSNLHSFLQSVTPIIPSKPLPESYMDNPIWEDTCEYFTLEDLWDCYEEWSAYGVGAPISLKDDLNVIQYYVPYLSAMQLYTIKPPTTLRNLSGELLSEGSDSGKNNSSDFSIKPAESSRNRLGYLYFEFTEISSPVWRIPLVEKISKFSEKHPGITTMNSTDLSPASWMAIAWYPIYLIPMTGVTKNISTYFLTYHTLSSSFQENLEDENYPLKKKENNGISLHPFGVASYKMQNNIWLNKVEANTKFNDLQSAADSWLKQLSFNHHDFNLFSSNYHNLDHIFLF